MLNVTRRQNTQVCFTQAVYQTGEMLVYLYAVLEVLLLRLPGITEIILAF